MRNLPQDFSNAAIPQGTYLCNYITRTNRESNARSAITLLHHREPSRLMKLHNEPKLVIQSKPEVVPDTYYSWPG